MIDIQIIIFFTLAVLTLPIRLLQLESTLPKRSL
jgi:hypothetical protein